MKKEVEILRQILAEQDKLQEDIANFKVGDEVVITSVSPTDTVLNVGMHGRIDHLYPPVKTSDEGWMQTYGMRVQDGKSFMVHEDQITLQSEVDYEQFRVK